MNIVILGLSITSSWGNGHAVTYRGLVRELVRRGHHVTFLERDMPWYAASRDLPRPPWGETALYGTFDQLVSTYGTAVANADAVIVGSYVPDGVKVGHWVADSARGVKAFYDIDTPVTLAAVQGGRCEYLDRELIPRFDLYLSFAGGRNLTRLEAEFGSPRARPLYCSVDPDHYAPRPDVARRWTLGYLGTYSPDRQPGLERLLAEPARRLPDERFCVAGSQFPDSVCWPENVARIEHLPPKDHPDYYTAQRFTLNLTRDDMIRAGHSPSVRIFEAAGCATPVISDRWEGIEDLLEPGREIFLADSTDDVVGILQETSPDEAAAVGQRARDRILACHTAAHRAAELEGVLREVAPATVGTGAA